MFCASTVGLVSFAKMLSECPFFSEFPSSLVRRRFPAQPLVAAARDRGRGVAVAWPWRGRGGGALVAGGVLVGLGGVLAAGASTWTN